MSNLLQPFRHLLLAGLLWCGLGGQVFSQTLAYDDRPRQEKQKNQKTLSTVLKELETRYEVNFTYRSELIEDKFVDKNLLEKDKSNLEDQLNKLLKPFNLVYKKADANYYLIYPETEKLELKKIERKTSLSVEAGIATTSTQRTFIAPLTSIKNLMQAPQEKTVTGLITDENQEGLPGVNIVVKGTTIGTVTDVSGNYRLNVPDDATTLVFFFSRLSFRRN